jgi:hypothetical protein
MFETMIGRRAAIAGIAGAALSPAMAAAQPRPPLMPRLPDGDGPGFAPMFNGKSLDGWDGDPRYWRVQDGAIVGEITPQTLLRSNTFLVWRGGEVADFELKAECRISAGGNSGLNYRSILVPDEITRANRYAMQGLQFDIDAANLFTGMVYEERGRGFIARRGQLARVGEAAPSQVIGTIGEAAGLRAAISPDWNTLHIVARGGSLLHLMNGQLMAAALDEAPNPRRSGLIGVQVHVGPPKKVEFRNLRLKRL